MSVITVGACTRMKLKYSVDLRGLQPQMAIAAMVVREVYRELDAGSSCTITSANDSKHSTGSLHYQGKALDFRTHDFQGDKKELVHMCKEALGPHFDVLLEGLGTPSEHVHLEHDPKEAP